MTLPTSGPLSINDIAGEFGGTAPHSLNEYYAGGGLVPAGASGTYGAVPSSGQISIQNFYGTAAQYQISRSLRFNSADTTNLQWTPSVSPTSRTKTTLSFWVKRSAISSGTYQNIYSVAVSSGFYSNSGFETTDQFTFGINTSNYVYTTQLFRDVGAWYHFVCVVDTTQATASDRLKVYVNGSRITSFSSSNYPSLNSTDNYLLYTYNQIIGGVKTSGTGGSVLQVFNGYISEFYGIDGQALTPSSFGQTNATTGVWEPIGYSGSYGTNGFYINFSDNSNTTAATLGKDYSGNGNNWTPNNFSVTAGAGNDSLVDTPTNYGTDTGAGGEVRGNYCTFNPNLSNAGSVSYSNGNLVMTMTGNADRYNLGTMAVLTGKWYWELTLDSITSNNVGIGICKSSKTANGPWVAYGGPDTVYYSNSDGWVVYGTPDGSGGGSYAHNDVVGVALNMDSNVITLYKNGTLYTSKSGAILTSVAHTLFIDVYNNGAGAVLNAGQRPFAYTAPSGFKALCTENLPTPTILDGGDYFNAVLYTGNGSTQSITGVGFQPDWVWFKRRSASASHVLVDVLRGNTKNLFSNLTDAEQTQTEYLTSFNADGFSLGDNNPIGTGDNNVSGATYVAWNWKANGAGVSNTAGTITSTVSANTTAGFSIVTYTGNNTANQTVGHGIGVAPSMIIVKNRTSGASSWAVYHASVGIGKYLELNKTDTPTTNSAFFDQVTSTVFGFDAGGLFINASGDNYVAYCFAPIAGYSAFGTYTGNGSTDGPFVYTGFRPAVIIIKRTDTSGNNWGIYDKLRSNPFNVVNGELLPSSSAAESTSFGQFDFTSNGFKLRSTNGGENASGGTYIYAAFAENPFKYSRAR